MKILIIDSDTGIRDYYRYSIESEFKNIEIIFASSIDEGLQKAAQSEFDLAITEADFGGDPFESIARVRQAGLPFVVVSREFSERFAVEALREGAMDFISKRNLKYGHLPAALARCLLEVPTWRKMQEFRRSLPSYSETKRFTEKLREGMAIEAGEAGFRSQLGYPALSEPKEGEVYEIVLLFFHLRLPEAIKTAYDETRVQAIYRKWLASLEHTVGSYGGRRWIVKTDSMAFAFPAESAVPAVLAAIDLNAQTYLNGAYMPFEKPGIVSAITRGQCRYTSESGNLVSEIINYAAHVVYRNDLRNEILIPESLLQQLPPRVKNYFFKERVFEDVTLYRFERIA